MDYILIGRYMINKQKLWFLTLFSLILVLSVYYIAMPEASLSSLIESEKTSSEKTETKIDANDSLATLRIEDDEAVLKEMNELESKLIDNLYFCGEILDVHGDCGGFNLQWAWSSGYLAGKCAAEK